MNRVEDNSEHAIRNQKYEIEMAEITQQPIAEAPPPDNKNTLVYKFKQQLIEAWRPVPSLSSSIILYLILTTFFVTIGVIMFIYTSQQFKKQIRYDNQCTSNSNCQVVVSIDQDVEPPIYFYYGLTNFNQNQRFFANSKSQYQIETGEQFSNVDAARRICGSKTTNNEIGWSTSANNTPLNPSDIAFPCGLIAYSFFNDTYQMKRQNDSKPIDISESGIAWPYDKNIYKNKDLSIQGIDLTNEHWLVWLRPAATSSFYKLWGIINSKLEKGTYVIKVKNNYSINFSQKWIKIAQTNVFGDNNLVLSIAYLSCAGICLLVLIGFIIGKIKSNFK